MLSAIIFDFDGVIANTEPLHLRAFREVLAAEGIVLTAEQYAARYLGLADALVFRAVARDRYLPLSDDHLAALLRRKADRYQELVAVGDVLITGVADRIREWSRRLPLAVASGALRIEIEDILDRADLRSCFTAIVAAEDVAHGKPAPEPYLTALARLQQAEGARRKAGSQENQAMKARGVVAIEDSVAGIASATAAGMRVVAVTTNHPADALTGADLVVRSVADLDLDVLARLV